MNGGANNTASGVAYTWGYPLLVSFDPVLFTALLGTQVTVTVAVSPQGSSSMSLEYLAAGRPRSHQFVPHLCGADRPKPKRFAGCAVEGHGLRRPTESQRQHHRSDSGAVGIDCHSSDRFQQCGLKFHRDMVTIPQTSFPTHARRDQEHDMSRETNRRFRVGCFHAVRADVKGILG
jgi:hypothetical protein